MRGLRALPRDAGAAAVEFALVSLLLFTILFGILQYGIGLWQVQQAQATTQDAARAAIAGFADCGVLGGLVDDAAARNGLDDSNIQDVDLVFVDASGTTITAPDRGDYLQLTVTYALSDFDLPIVPFPDSVERTTTMLLSDLDSKIAC